MNMYFPSSPRAKAHCTHVLSVLQVFMAHTYLELQQNEQAVRIYDGLSQAGLAESTYIMAQVGHVTIRDVFIFLVRKTSRTFASSANIFS